MIIGATTWLWVSPLTTAAAEDLIPRVAKLGFGAIELPLEDPSLIDAKRIGRLLTDHHLKASVCGAFGPGRDLTHADASVRRSTLDYIERCLDFAAEIDAPALCGPLYSEVGKRRYLPDAQRRAEWSLAVEGVHAACVAAAKRGKRIAIEPINRFETDLVNSVADGVRFARNVAHPAAGVMIDSFHMTLEEDNLEAAIRSAGDLLVHVQVSENQRSVPGTGLTDWAAFARGLAAVKYQGMVVIESFTPENRDLAAAVCIWKHRVPDQDTFAREGLAFLQRTFNPSASTP
ncbi:MAG TPA: sugar phosphate isomerase/epimerase family protein [Opitutaceae bacterium]